MNIKKLNLQLFANHVNVTTDATSGNNLSAEMKTFYDMTLIDEAARRDRFQREQVRQSSSENSALCPRQPLLLPRV